MKKILKTIDIVAILLALILLISSLTCFADSPKKVNGPDVSVTVTEIGEDGVNVDIGFISNPGVGAMTFTVMYDADCFKVTGDFDKYGYFYTAVGITGYGVVDHPDRGYVSFVQADGGSTRLYTGTGTFLTLQFRVIKKVPGKHWFKIGNINPTLRGENLDGCFADFEHNKFVPTAKNDYYFIPATDDNPCVNHDYTFVNKTEPSCTAEGYSLYRCSICGKSEKRSVVPALGHDFDTKWTVDREADKGIAKIISRHCKRCNERTDIRYLTENQEMPKEVQKGDKDTSNKADEKQDDKNSDIPDGNVKISVPNDFLPQIPDDEYISADDIIESVKNGDYFYYGGVKLPDKIKTFGDFIAKAFVYLFGAGDKKGIITLILDAIFKTIF